MNSPTKTGRHLNVILTVNAALLSAVLWTQLTGTSGLASQAVGAAQTPPKDGGIPNAGGQRERMIDELQAIRESIDGLKKTVEGGKLKVTIANIDEMKAAAAAAGAKAAEDKNK